MTCNLELSLTKQARSLDLIKLNESVLSSRFCQDGARETGHAGCFCSILYVGTQASLSAIAPLLHTQSARVSVIDREEMTCPYNPERTADFAFSSRATEIKLTIFQQQNPSNFTQFIFLKLVDYHLLEIQFIRLSDRIGL